MSEGGWDGWMDGWMDGCASARVWMYTLVWLTRVYLRVIFLGYLLYIPTTVGSVTIPVGTFRVHARGRVLALIICDFRHWYTTTR